MSTTVPCLHPSTTALTPPQPLHGGDAPKLSIEFSIRDKNYVLPKSIDQRSALGAKIAAM
jgi:hypothetical protein